MAAITRGMIRQAVTVGVQRGTTIALLQRIGPVLLPLFARAVQHDIEKAATRRIIRRLVRLGVFSR